MNSVRRVVAWMVLLAWCGLAAGVGLLGQSTTTDQISGQVTDVSGGAIAGARVTIRQTATGLTRSTMTGSHGNYRLLNLPVGPYLLTVHAPGFKTYVQKGIVLQVSINPVINAQLQVGAVSQTVQVTANSAMVETHNASVNQVISRRRILALPLNGRNAADLVLLAGAAVATSAYGDTNSSKNFNEESVTISVAGGQDNTTNYMLDGADNNDAFTNVNLPFPFPDALQEFSVQTSDLSAQYGVHPGGVVNVVTKSGTNQFHGDLFEFVRNYKFNAAQTVINYQGSPSDFKKPTDSLKRNQFGGTIGGPIIHNKLFFFGGYQGTINRQLPSGHTAFTATPAVLAGNWSAMESAACNGGKAKTLGAPFVNNTINPSLYNPQALKMLALVPTSTDPQGCGFLQYGIPNNTTEHQFIARTDYNVSPKQEMFVRYFLDGFSLPPDYTNNLLTTQAYGQEIRSQALVLGDTYTLSPTLINSLHLSGTRLRINRGPASNVPNPTQFGVNIHSLVPNFINMSISHYFTTGCGICSPGHFNTNAVQAADDVSWVVGNHQIGYGFDWIHTQTNELSNFTSNGQFSFTGNFTGNGLADYLLGDLKSFTQGGAEQENWRENYVGAYIQDDWKVNTNFSINAGLRWDPYFPEYDKFGRGGYFSQAAFNQGMFTSHYANAPAGLLFAGDPGVPTRYVQQRMTNLSPRLGFIWDPSGNGRTTLRAGYGLIYDSPENFYFDRYADQAPWGSGVTITAPAGGLTNPYLGFPGGDPFPLPFPPSFNAFFPAFGTYVSNPTNLKNTYMEQWNMTLQHQIGNWMVEASYIGSATHHIWMGFQANPSKWLTPAQCATAAAAGGWSASKCDTSGNEQNQKLLSLINNGSRFGQAYGSIATTDPGGNANYNALLLSANHRFNRYYTVLTNYTWSHCLDYGEFGGEIAGQTYQNNFNRNQNYGNCSYDIPQVFNLSLVAESNINGSGAAKAIFGDWRFSNILTIHSGSPYTVTLGKDYALTGQSGGLEYPNVNGNPNVAPKTIKEWFNPSVFSCPTSGTDTSSCGPPTAAFQYGDSGRNYLFGPGYWNMDVSLSRFFQVREGQRIEIRADAFNLFNHANWNGPNTGLNNSKTIGQITGASGPRIMQFALKYEF